MKTILQTTIPGTPVQWARARVGDREGDEGAWQKTFHTAPEQKRYKAVVKSYGAADMLQRRIRKEHEGKPAPLGTAVVFDCRVFLPIPPSWNREEELAAREGRLRPTSTPDLDNWIKLPMDALQGIAYANDGQVVGFGGTGLWYATKPRLEVHVYLAPPGLPMTLEELMKRIDDAMDLAGVNPLEPLVKPEDLAAAIMVRLGIKL